MTFFVLVRIFGNHWRLKNLSERIRENLFFLNLLRTYRGQILAQTFYQLIFWIKLSILRKSDKFDKLEIPVIITSKNATTGIFRTKLVSLIRSQYCMIFRDKLFWLTWRAFIVLFSQTSKIGSSTFSRIDKICFSSRDSAAGFFEVTTVDGGLVRESDTGRVGVTLIGTCFSVGHSFIRDLVTREDLKWYQFIMINMSSDYKL